MLSISDQLITHLKYKYPIQWQGWDNYQVVHAKAFYIDPFSKFVITHKLCTVTNDQTFSFEYQTRLFSRNSETYETFRQNHYCYSE